MARRKIGVGAGRRRSSVGGVLLFGSLEVLFQDTFLGLKVFFSRRWEERTGLAVYIADDMQIIAGND